MSCNVLCIGIGLGGCRFAEAMVSRVGKTTESKIEPIYINISSDELGIFNTTSEKSKVRIGSIDGGAGKSRENAINIFSNDFDYVALLSTVKQRVIDSNIDLITISFTTGGGTGSSIGPLLTRMLMNSIEEQKIVDRDVIIMGVALLPSFNEGIGVFRNTLLTINDINKGIKKGDRYFLVKNPGNEGANFTEKCEAVNGNASALIAKYIAGTTQISNLGVLDMNDRRMGLTFSGIHALSKLSDCAIKQSPFITPGSNVCKMMLCEIPEDNSEMYENEVSSTTSLDFKYGYTSSETGIMAHHGFRNIEKETLPYRKRFDELKELDINGNMKSGENSLQSLKSDVYNYSIKKDNTIKDKDSVEDVTTPAKKKSDIHSIIKDFSNIDDL